MSGDIDYCEVSKINAIKYTVLPLKVYSFFNVIYDLLFSIAGLVLFGLNPFFVLLMLAALMSCLYVTWYAHEAIAHGEKPKNATSLWFWENSTIVWRYTLFKFLLFLGFIGVAVVESAHIDVIHTISHFSTEVFAVSLTLCIMIIIMLLLSIYVIQKHHGFLRDIFILFDATGDD
jgi:hypothetical protein